MASTTLSMFLLCCLLATSLAKPNSDPEVSSRGLDLSRLHINTVALVGQNVTFTCSASVGSSARIQWFESSSTGNPSIISDGTLILPGHPNSAQYVLDTNNARQFDLTIMNVALSDGGPYHCIDANAPTSEKQQHTAYLTILQAQQNCITTVPPSGVAIEDTYYTYECDVNYKGTIPPSMLWTGPAPFGQAQSDNGVRVWSGLSFYASRTMTNQHWTNSLNFLASSLPDPTPPDTATNVPTYQDIYDTSRIQVSWPPSGLYADPIRPLNEYVVGDVIECFADAFPSATFEWHNMRTNERFPGSLFIITQDMEDTQNPMRCETYNIINGFRYNRDLQVQINVPIPPTTPTTLPPTTTTPAPAVAPCNNLAGRWESKFPIPAFLCVEVDAVSGNIHAVVRNATDTFWLDLVGATSLPTFDHASMTGIWAQNRAVSTFIGECHNCYGEEVMLVSAISRTKGGPPCGQPGQIFYSQEYEFRRNSLVSCPPISIPIFGD